jgi:hypothetical protein
MFVLPDYRKAPEKPFDVAHIFSPKLDLIQNNSLRSATPYYVITKLTNLGGEGGYG